MYESFFTQKLLKFKWKVKLAIVSAVSASIFSPLELTVNGVKFIPFLPVRFFINPNYF